MERLIDIVNEYVGAKYAEGTAWYAWPFNPDKVPSGVLDGRTEGNDWYARNVDLKHRLHEVWRDKQERRADLERYYIADWGGVRGNRPQTLAAYHRASADENIANGAAGIASWSKALCVRDPLQFAIFDARVSVSLNALQIIHRARIDTPIRFPVLPSQNRIVKWANQQLKNHFKTHVWPEESPDFFRDYLMLCRSVAARLGSPDKPLPIYAVEMALFAHTEELLREALPGGAPA